MGDSPLDFCEASTKTNLMKSLCLISNFERTLIFRCLFIYQPQEIGISMTSISWSKCGNILAIATSQSLSVINTLTWAMIDDLDIPVTVDQEKHNDVNLLIEMEKPLTTNDVDVRVARELCR